MALDYDVKVSFECTNCKEQVELEPHFVYPDYSGKNGYYDTSDRGVLKLLKENKCVVKEDKIYCCPECAEEAE
jgi:hypothetical protein